MIRYYSELPLHPMPASQPETLADLVQAARKSQTIVYPVITATGNVLSFNVALTLAATDIPTTLSNTPLSDDTLHVLAEAPIDTVALAAPIAGDRIIIVSEDSTRLGWTTSNECLSNTLSSYPPDINELISRDNHITLQQDATLYAAHKELFDQQSQVVVVMDENNVPAGLITDMDISQCIEKGQDIWTLTLNEKMTHASLEEEKSLIEKGLCAESPLFGSQPIITVDDKGNILGLITSDKLGITHLHETSGSDSCEINSATTPSETLILDTVLNSSLRTGIVGTDEYLNIIYFNEAISDFVESPDELRLGGNIWQVTDSCGISRQSFTAYLENARDHREQVIVNWVKVNNTRRYIQCRLTTVDSQTQTAGFVLSIQDITTQRNAEDAIRKLAYQDKLTQLPNRLLFEERLDGETKRARRNKSKFAIMMLDLDGFKLVNDQYGHTVGDELLCTVANRLQYSVRETDTVARFGGDEFISILPDIAHAKDVEQLADKMRSVVRQRCVIDDIVIEIDASIGFSIYPDDSTNSKELLDLADARMYKDKRKKV